LEQKKRNNISVLFIDYEPDNRNSFKARFCRNFDITLTASGEEGLDLFEEIRPEVIISDQHMPGLEGVDVLKQIKRIDPHTCRILITGYSRIESVQEAIQKGIIDLYMQKPWDSQKFIEAIVAGSEMNRDRIAGRIKDIVQPVEEGLYEDKVPSIQQPF
jgi:response regulator RpfG family c-di-GMP phosphodiesterase